MKPIFSFLFLLLFISACTKHYAGNITSTTKATVIPNNMTDILIGIWRLNKIEAPGMMDKMTTFGSQAEREAMMQNITKYQDAMKGLTVTFNKDSSYTSVYNGQSDVGMWKVNRHQEIEAISKVTNAVSIFQIVSAEPAALVVKYSPGDVQLLMTFAKQ